MSAAALALAASVILAGCSEGGSTATADGAQDSSPLELCVVHNSDDHPSITAAVKGMDDEAVNFNANIAYFDPANDPQKQVSMIEDCVARQPDVIVVNAVDPVAAVPAVKRASEAGIKVLTMNADVAADGKQYTEAFIGSESYDQGYAVGLMVAEGLNNKGSMVIVAGNPGQTDAVNRTEGLKAAFADVGADIEILAEQPGEWSKDTALTVMTDLLTRFADIDAVFGHDDPMALGALEAVKAAGRDGIKVYGVNGNEDACQAIKSGEMAGTALQLTELVGVYTVRAAHDLKVGRLIDAEILAPTAPVTPENIADWESQCW
jgi:ribose transport system substrate-binding protein